jgi:hypothetical protein
MPRPSKTREWPNHNTITINLNETDVIQNFETDEKGRVRTKKRAWARHKATVILGEPNVHDNCVEVPENNLIFECEVFENGDISPIGYFHEKVTVIIHL